MINKGMTIEQILRTDAGTADILMESGMHCLRSARLSAKTWSRPALYMASM